MRNLNHLFGLLLFPFVFLIQRADMHLLGRKKEDYHYHLTPMFLFLASMLLFMPSYTQAACDTELVYGAGNDNGAIDSTRWSSFNTWSNIAASRSYIGNTYLYIPSSSSKGGSYQSFPTTIGKTYRVSAILLGTDVNRNEAFSPGASYLTIEGHVPSRDSAYIVKSSDITGGSEQTINLTFTATTSTSYISIRSTRAWRYPSARDISVKEVCGTDELTSFTAPSEVTRGETITVTVDYEVSEDREITAGFQQNHSPWTGWGWETATVSAGTGTVNLSITIPTDQPLGNAYQIPIVLLPVGGNWLTRLDDKVENPVNLIDDNTPVNRAPIATPQSITTTENTSVDITLTGSDPDGDPITFSIVSGPSHGTLSGSEPNLTYTPNLGYTGNDSFVYKVCDNPHALCTEATVSIVIESSSEEGGHGSIKPLEFTWTDGQPNVYYNSGGDPKESIISTIHFYDDKLHTFRTIDAVATFKYPDVYKFNSIETKTMYTTKNGNFQYRNVNPNNVSPEWQSEGESAFSSPDLNYYIGGDSPQGVADATYPNRPTEYTVRHLLSYSGGVKVGNGGDGYVIVSERGGNNHFYLLARDLDGNELGNIFIRMTKHYTCSQSNPLLPVTTVRDRHIDSYSGWEVDYWASGRMQENGQEICVAVYPIQDLAPAGSTIGSIEMWAASKDPGDGKVMLVSYLDEPEICYDYTVSHDGMTIDSDDRNITIGYNGDIAIKVAIKSMEGDVLMTDSKIKLTLDPSSAVTFQDAKYSPNTSNTLIDAVHIGGDQSQPHIALGSDVSEAGGKIAALERYFTKFNYTMNSGISTLQGRFEIDLTVTTNPTGLNPIFYFISSRNGTLPRCEQSQKYNPTWGYFNIERTDSASFNALAEPEKRFPLYTQVVGKDFDFSIVAYDKNATPPYSQELSLDGNTADIELINAMTFRDDNATFVCNNPDPDIIQTLTATGDKHLFATFDNNSRVNMSSLDIRTDTALRSAAFRIWYIVDKNNSIVPYTSTDPSDNAYFQGIYNTYLKADDTTLQASGTTGFCTDDTLGAPNGCSNYANPELGTSGCYACMRDFFSKAVCSRDNFAIRPAAYRVSIADSNESASPASTIKLGSNDIAGAAPMARLVAGYRYKLDGNATSYVNDQTVAKGYTRTFDNTLIDDLSSLLQFKDQVACYDQNATPWDLHFVNGKITGVTQDNQISLTSGNLVKHSNAGKYAYGIHDSNWTIVDQQRYPFKTFGGVDDCINDDNSIPDDSTSKPGCDINSTLVTNTGLQGDPVYNALYLQYEPYSFDLSDINFSIRPNSRYLFMTNLDNTYYQTDESINLTMAAVHEGNITAMSKDGRVTTNFTDNCAAEEISLHIARITTPDESDLNVSMQQALVYGSDPLKTRYDDNQTGSDANLSLAAAGFEDQAPYGSTHIRIYSTFKKPTKQELDDQGLDEGINPIRASYLDLRARSEDANASAHLALHIPKGIVAQDKNVTFLYGRVVPNKHLYRVKENDVDTTLKVIVYCDGTNSPCDDDDLNTSATAEGLSGDWYLATALFDRPDLMFGETTLDINYFKGKPTKIIMRDTEEGGNTNTEAASPTLPQRHFESTALKQKLNISMDNPAESNRPTRARIGIYPPVWLLFDPNPSDRPPGKKAPAKLEDMNNYFDVLFSPKSTKWTGYGKTGHVVGDTDSGDDINTLKTRRLEW